MSNSDYITSDLTINEGTKYLLIVKSLVEYKRPNYEALQLSFSVGLKNYENYNEIYKENTILFDDYKEILEIKEFSIPRSVQYDVINELKLMYVISYSLLHGSFPSNETLKRITMEKESIEYQEAFAHFKEIVGFGACEIVSTYHENKEDKLKLIFEELAQTKDYPHINIEKRNEVIEEKLDEKYLEIKIEKTKEILKKYQAMKYKLELERK